MSKTECSNKSTLFIYKSQYFFSKSCKNKILFTLLACSLPLCSVKNCAAFEKSRSDGTELATIVKYFNATLYNFGNCTL